MDQLPIQLDRLSHSQALPIVRKLLNREHQLTLEESRTYDEKMDKNPRLIQGLTSEAPRVICEIFSNGFLYTRFVGECAARISDIVYELQAKTIIFVFLMELDDNRINELTKISKEFNLDDFIIYDLKRLQESIQRYSDLVEEIKNQSFENEKSSFSQSSSKGNNDGQLSYYLGGSIWDGNDDQAERFYKEGIWQNGYDDRFIDIVNTVKTRDIILLKSSFAKDGISYLRIKGVGVVIENPQDGKTIFVKWLSKNVKIDIANLGHYRSTFYQVNGNDLNTILEQGNIVNLLESELLKDVNDNDKEDRIPKSIKNITQVANFNSDAHNGPDHFDIKKDVSAFARIIASKQLKPPLAIALFGEWGSGKSFFMEKLITKINEFTNPKSEQQKKIYCDGIVQIRFNAWSYMDANLWASLVSNIYEKLDEYISKQTKGDSAKERVKSILNQELSVVNEEREKAIEAQKQLIATEKNLCLEKENLEKEKDKLLSETFKKEIDKAYIDINKKLNFDNTLKKQLKLYGIDEARLNELAKLSPNHVIQEIKSWYYFIKNLLHFNWWQIVMIVVCAVLLIVVNCNIPLVNHLVSGHLTRAIISFFSIAGPVFVKFFNSAKVYIDSYEKVKRYKDELDNKLKEISIRHAIQIKVIEDKLSENNDKLVQKVTEIHKLDREIQTISHNLQYSVTQKAFLDFIKTKSSDEKYDKALSIISTIRKDFETLSELFHEYNIPPNLSDEEREEVKNKKAMIDSFKDQFKRPLDRIVLYVDDLDRCSEDRVIEVLEAVNLLMAYPLFVVIVGVDKRWVKNALHKKYELHFSKSSKDDTSKYEMILPEDYLEKIFQIPFQLQRASDEEVKSMIRKQLEPHLESDFDSDDFDNEDFGTNNILGDNEGNGFGDNEGNGFVFNNSQSETLPSKTSDEIEYLSISEEHIKLMECFSGIIGANPRAIKRFINLYQIISAHDDFRALAIKQYESHAIVMLFLAILNGRFKDRSEDIKLELKGSLKEFLNNMKHNGFDSLAETFKEDDQYNMYLTSEMSSYRRQWDLVKRFTFVSVS